MSSIAERFAENLKRELQRSPLTQEQLTAQAEIHHTRIARLLRGAQIPRIDTLIKLEKALDLKPATLIEGITWVPPASAPTGEFTFKDPPRKR